jgi:SAM-dependent methyltransferase
MPGTYDYHAITETPQQLASIEQIARLYHRYRFARSFIESGKVLEAACGSGMGLGFLAGKSSFVIGGDIDRKNAYQALSINEDPSVCIEILDCHDLPFKNQSFDFVLLFEAIYYLHTPERFIREAQRVLKENGVLMIGSVNKDWSDFHASPCAQRYFAVPDLLDLLRPSFPKVEMYGAFPTAQKGNLALLLSFLKRAAIRFDLIPGSLSARARLKRLFFGPLYPLPDRIFENMTPYQAPAVIPFDQPNRDFKIIYAVARKKYQ